MLGSFEGAAYEERTVTLGRGDAVAIFTDGLTEVGPSRKDMLGSEGVTGLLAGSAIPAGAAILAEAGGAGSEAGGAGSEAGGAGAVAEHLVLRLIAGVDRAAAGGVVRDDVCLLVGVVE